MTHAFFQISAVVFLVVGCRTTASSPSAAEDPAALGLSAPYSQIASPDQAPAWLQGNGRLVWQEPFTGAGLSSAYRAWIPPLESKPPNGFPLVLFFHGNTGSNYGPVILAPEKVTNGQATEGNAGSFQEFPTLEQARWEAAQGQEFWNRAIFVAVLSPSFTQRKSGEQYVDRPSQDGRLMSTWGSLNSELSIVAPETLTRHGDFVVSLLEEKFAGLYDKTRVVVVGQSGGSLFSSSTVVPRLSHLGYQGTAVLMCGIDVPPEPGTLAGVSQNFNVHLRTTAKESSGLRKSVIPNGLNAYAQEFKLEWPTFTESTLFVDGKTWASPHFTVAVDGKGSHCDFATQSEPKIVVDALCGFHDWPELEGSTCP